MASTALARQIRSSVDETEQLLETLERLGYVRRLAATQSERRDEHDWLLICDETVMTLKPAFENLAVDPGNTLMNIESLGLQALRTRWFQSDWLKAPLAEALKDAA